MPDQAARHASPSPLRHCSGLLQVCCLGVSVWGALVVRAGLKGSNKYPLSCFLKFLAPQWNFDISMSAGTK